MKRILLLVAFSGLLHASSLNAGDPSLPGFHPLTQPEAGEVLLSEFRCGACHEPGTKLRKPNEPKPETTRPEKAHWEPGELEKTAPDLTAVGTRVSPTFLRAYLASPTKAQPHTRMPDLLNTYPVADRERIAEALTHFLIAQSRVPFSGGAADMTSIARGKQLFHSVGCVACHGPQESIEPLAPRRNDIDDDSDDDVPQDPRQRVKPMSVSLAHVRNKYSIPTLAEFLFQPLRVRASGRMPDMKLTRAEADSLASYLLRESVAAPAALVPEAGLVELGKKYYAELNCAACHPLAGIQAASLRPWPKDVNGGCLSGESAKAPRFAFDDAQRAALKAALAAPVVVESERVTLAKTLTTFQCIACHVRDDYGGVPDSYSVYFSGSQEKLGDDGRIPPPLSLAGAKLQPAWLKKVLFDGESVRTYMSTRMPQYGSANLPHLPALLARLDHIDGPALKIPSPESRNERDREHEKRLRAAGRELLGEKGLNCIACHNFNGKAALVNQGIELLTSYERLQPAWFYHYLRNPGAFRPRTVMPTAWPNGEATFKTILDGNTDLQIEAIWYYLSLGTSAADPPGLRSPSTKLTVDDVARTYRGRSRVAGFRGIAVGLPEKLNYAFNAETGTLTAIWEGEFVGVNRSGQGSGDFHPATEPITLAQDVSFAKLLDDQAPWPRLPVMTKEARTNPDPLYPKNVGYQFRGYSLGEKSIPTFRYQSGSIAIEDRSQAEKRESALQLRRTLRLTTAESQTVWFRALTGEITRESDSTFRLGRLRLTLPPCETSLRPLPDSPERFELLCRLNLSAGEITWELVYELLNKK